MLRWVQMLNAHLRDGHPLIRIIGSFGHTGNFLAHSPSSNLGEVTARFHRLLDHDWVVRPISDVRAALMVLADATEPSSEESVRWTPGLAFHAGAGVARGTIDPTARAFLWRIAAWAIGAWKHDRLAANGRLNRSQRAGGWGGVSHDIQRQIGGQWTARSRRTVDGLMRMTTDRPPLAEMNDTQSPGGANGT
jgi:hypothetical protein